MRLGFQQEQHAHSGWWDWNQLAHLQSHVPCSYSSHCGLWQVISLCLENVAVGLDCHEMPGERARARENARDSMSLCGSLLWIPRKIELSDLRLGGGYLHGKELWSQADQMTSEHPFSPLVLVFHGSFNLMSAEHSTYRVTWLSSEATIFPLSWDPPCRFTTGSPLSLQQITCNNVSFSVHFRESFMPPKELVCLLLSPNYKNKKTGHNFSFCFDGQEAQSGI